jgi:hypothetical protein
MLTNIFSNKIAIWIFLSITSTNEPIEGLAKRELLIFRRHQLDVKGESTLQGGHFGHFHDMYVKYISTKHIAFNFGFHLWCLGLIF